MTEQYIKALKIGLLNSEVSINEPMKNHTSFKTGGPCDVMVKAYCEKDIKLVILLSNQYKQPLQIVGNCTNLIVRDKGIKGIVLKISQGFDQVIVYDNQITIKSGALLSKLSKVAMNHELTGLEFASGIPGTVGGGVSMNAGAYGGEISEILVSSTFLDEQGNTHILTNEQHEFTYRKSIFTRKKWILLESTFALQNGNKESILAKMNELNAKRKDKQPLNLPSAGSVFKRPLGYFVGQLIDQCNLKGYKINDAQISTLHSGFIVNLDNANSQDIINLIDYIKIVIYKQFKVELETEVKIIGEN
ncbi:MAG: UDP-N-acetylmuramate dehydrogenase [Clostridiales bacterium]|nr:UDP-N-acetylmuramate dehydrogenase [Clostridiales bacterium]